MAAQDAALRTGGDPAGSRARLDAYARWLAAAGPWHLYTVCPTLVAPFSPLASNTVAPDVSALVEGVAATLGGGHTLVVLDLEPVGGVHVAAEINARGAAHVVLLVPRWPYAEAVLPTDELTRALVDLAPRLVQTASTNVVFVLDTHRSKSVVRPRRDRRADNRYRLVPGDLPNLAALRAHDVRRVVKIQQQ